MRLSFKEEAKNVIESLPNEATMEEIIHALYIGRNYPCVVNSRNV